MKCNWILYLLPFWFVSCSSLHVEEEDLPDTQRLRPATMVTTLPVVNILADPSDVNHMLSAYFSKVFVSGELTYSGPYRADTNGLAMEMEVRGRSSVGADFPMKSLGVVLNQSISADAFGFQNITTLPGHQVGSFSGFRLRSSGNDFGNTQLKDLAYSRLAVACGINVELMYGSPVQVFINNSYYGLLHMRTESNVQGISELMQIDSSLVTVLKVKDESENLKVDEGNPRGAQALLAAIQAEDGAAIRDEIDEANFIDYIIYQDYIGNGDWANNIKAYNHNEGKFRFILFDLDLAGNATSIMLLPKLEFLSADIAKIYRAFAEDPNFEERLDARQRQLYTRLSPEKFNQIVDDLVLQIEPEIPYLIAQYGAPESTLHWKMAVAQLKLDFAGRDRSIRNKYDIE